MQQKQNYTLPIIVMFFLFAMISFVTGFQNPFGIILKQQLGLANWQSQLGNAANFISGTLLPELSWFPCFQKPGLGTSLVVQ